MKTEENVKCMMTKILSSNTLDVLDEVQTLTSMSGQVATPEQQIDLLGFWEVGHERFENQILFTERSISCSTKEGGQAPYLCFIQETKEKNKVA